MRWLRDCVGLSWCGLEVGRSEEMRGVFWGG